MRTDLGAGPDIESYDDPVQSLFHISAYFFIRPVISSVHRQTPRIHECRIGKGTVSFPVHCCKFRGKDGRVQSFVWKETFIHKTSCQEAGRSGCGIKKYPLNKSPRCLSQICISRS